MFDFLKRPKKNRELETLLDKVANNVANNYKDAAQMDLKDFEARLRELDTAGALSDAQKAYYYNELENMQIRMKNFTHKDQKPYWT